MTNRRYLEIIAKSELFYARLQSIFADGQLYGRFAALKALVVEQLAELDEVLKDEPLNRTERETLTKARGLYRRCATCLDETLGFFTGVGRA